MDEASERRDDAPERAPHADAGATGAPNGIDAIEELPLAERAPRYQELADRLRTELERSDPSRSDA